MPDDAVSDVEQVEGALVQEEVLNDAVVEGALVQEHAIEDTVTSELDAAAIPYAQALTSPCVAPSVPFSLYLFAWVLLAVGTVVYLKEAALAGKAAWDSGYAYIVYAGAGMAGLGPVLSVLVWLVARAGRCAEEREGLLATTLLQGAKATFLGTALWLAALYVVDVLRAGTFARSS